jgi:hypothetical protein
MNILNNIREYFRNFRNPIQAYVDRPMAGRLAPQPNNNMLATRIVRAVLRLK